MTKRSCALFGACWLVLAACGGDDTSPPPVPTDAGARDTGTRDASALVDAAPMDGPAGDGGELPDATVDIDGSIVVDGMVVSCGAMDVTGTLVGGCTPRFLGVEWTGSTCADLNGCACMGADCARLYASSADCFAAQGDCLCGEMDARGEGACAAELGYVWDGTECNLISGCSCVGANCGDIYATQTACLARYAGCSGLCAADESAGEGACATSLGFRWSGSAETGCEEVTGCSCVGEECGELHETAFECAQVNRGCLRCAPNNAFASGDCDMSLGVFWNGTECVELRGCECVGAECVLAQPSIAACAYAFRACRPGVGS